MMLLNRASRHALHPTALPCVNLSSVTLQSSVIPSENRKYSNVNNIMHYYASVDIPLSVARCSSVVHEVPRNCCAGAECSSHRYRKVSNRAALPIEPPQPYPEVIEGILSYKTLFTDQSYVMAIFVFQPLKT